MTTVTIRPLTTAVLEVSMPGQTVEIPTANGPAMMQALKAQGAVVRVDLKGYGYRLDANNVDAALEMAGLSSYQAAQQTAKGYIEF